MTTDARTRGRKGVARRARQLRAFPLCCHCEQEGRVVLAVIADHVEALVNGGRDDGPLQSLCVEHHRLKTAQDMGHTTMRRYGCDAQGRSLDPEHPRNVARGTGVAGNGPEHDRTSPRASTIKNV